MSASTRSATRRKRRTKVRVQALSTGSRSRFRKSAATERRTRKSAAKDADTAKDRTSTAKAMKKPKTTSTSTVGSRSSGIRAPRKSGRSKSPMPRLKSKAGSGSPSMKGPTSGSSSSSSSAESSTRRKKKKTTATATLSEPIAATVQMKNETRGALELTLTQATTSSDSNSNSSKGVSSDDWNSPSLYESDDEMETPGDGGATHKALLRSADDSVTIVATDSSLGVGLAVVDDVIREPSRSRSRRGKGSSRRHVARHSADFDMHKHTDDTTPLMEAAESETIGFFAAAPSSGSSSAREGGSSPSTGTGTRSFRRQRRLRNDSSAAMSSGSENSTEIVFMDPSTSRTSSTVSHEVPIYEDAAVMQTTSRSPSSKKHSKSFSKKSGVSSSSSKKKRTKRLKKKKVKKVKSKKKTSRAGSRKSGASSKASSRTSSGVDSALSGSTNNSSSSGGSEALTRPTHSWRSGSSQQHTDSDGQFLQNVVGMTSGALARQSASRSVSTTTFIDPSKLPEDPNSSIKDSETKRILLAAAAAATVTTATTVSLHGKLARGSVEQLTHKTHELLMDAEVVESHPHVVAGAVADYTSSDYHLYKDRESVNSSMASDMQFAKAKPLPSSPDPGGGLTTAGTMTRTQTRHTSTDVRPPTPEMALDEAAVARQRVAVRPQMAVTSSQMPVVSSQMAVRPQMAVGRRNSGPMHYALGDATNGSGAGVRLSCEYGASLLSSASAASYDLRHKAFCINDAMHNYTAYHLNCVAKPALLAPRTYFLCELLNRSVSTRHSPSSGLTASGLGMHRSQQPSAPSLQAASVFDRYFSVHSYAKFHSNLAFTGVPPMKTNEMFHGEFSFVSAIPHSTAVAHAAFGLVSVEDDPSVFTLQECGDSAFVLFGLSSECAAELVHRYGKTAKELEFFSYFSTANTKPIARCGMHGRVKPPLVLQTLAEIKGSLNEKVRYDVSSVECDRCRCAYASDGDVMYSCGLGGGSKVHPLGRHYCVDCVNEEMRVHLNNETRIVIEEPSLSGRTEDYSLSFASEYPSEITTLIAEELQFKSDWIDFLPRDKFLSAIGLTRRRRDDSYIMQKKKKNGSGNGNGNCCGLKSARNGGVVGSEDTNTWVCILKFKKTIDYKPMLRKIQMSAFHLKYCFFPDVPCRVEVFDSLSSAIADVCIERRFHCTEWLLCWLFALPIVQLFGSVIRSSHHVEEERFERSLSMNLSLALTSVRSLLWDPIHVAHVKPSKKSRATSNVASILRTKKRTADKCAYFCSQLVYSLFVHLLWAAALVPAFYNRSKKRSMHFGVLVWNVLSISLLALWCALDYSMCTPQEHELFPLSASIEVDLEWHKKAQSEAHSPDFYRAFSMCSPHVISTPLRDLMSDLGILNARLLPKEFPVSLYAIRQSSWKTAAILVAMWLSLVASYVIPVYFSNKATVDEFTAGFGVLCHGLLLVALMATLRKRALDVVSDLWSLAAILERSTLGVFLDLRRCESNVECVTEMHHYLVRKYAMVLSSLEIPLLYIVVLSSLSGAVTVAAAIVLLCGKKHTVLRSDWIPVATVFVLTTGFLCALYLEFVDGVKEQVRGIKRRMAFQMQTAVDCLCIDYDSYDCLFVGLRPAALMFLWGCGILAGAVSGALLSMVLDTINLL